VYRPRRFEPLSAALLLVQDDRDPAIQLPYLDVVTVNIPVGVRFGRLVNRQLKSRDAT
jgi:hypothetical protein